MTASGESLRQKASIGRAAAATLLGKTKPGVNYYHGKGLSPWQDEKHEWCYNLEEVERLATVLRARQRKSSARPRDIGTMAAKVFTMFDSGIPLAEVVQRVRIEPERILTWYTMYLTGYETPKNITPEQLALEKIRNQTQRETARLEFEKEKLHVSEMRAARKRE